MLARLDAIPFGERDYTSAETFTLNARFVTIDRAWIQAQPQNKFEPLHIIQIDSLSAIDPQWLDAPAGTPRYLVRTAGFTARLYPKPDSANTGQTVRTYGLEFPSDMSADTDVPNLPLNLSDIFPNFMAYKAFITNNEPARAKEQFDLFNTRFQNQKNVSTKFSQATMRWKWAVDD